MELSPGLCPVSSDRESRLFHGRVVFPSMRVGNERRFQDLSEPQIFGSRNLLPLQESSPSIVEFLLGDSFRKESFKLSRNSGDNLVEIGRIIDGVQC